MTLPSIPAEPAVHPEQSLLGAMLQEFRNPLEHTFEMIVALLERLEIRYDVMSAHELTYRHGLIFACGVAALGGELSEVPRFLAPALLAYSLPLIAVDRAIDLKLQVQDWRPVADSLRESQTLTHAGYEQLWASFSDDAAVKLVASVALRVSIAMQRDDAARTFAIPTDPATYIRRYLTSQSSRLYGSGVATLLLGLAAISQSRKQHLRRFLVAGETIGFLRQIADELLDVEDDIDSGLITLPTAYALAVSGQMSHLDDDTGSNWAGGRLSISSAPQVQQAILQCGCVETLVGIAGKIAQRRASALADNDVESIYLHALMLQRLLQMDRAKIQGLSDTAGGLSVKSLLDHPPPTPWRETVREEADRRGWA